MNQENMPRRLARFYRKQNNQSQAGYNNYNYSYNEPPQQSRRSQKTEEENYLNPSNTNTLKGIPTMDYEDVDLELDRKNREEIQRIREKNMVEKLALEEIEKFKIQNKRMPNQKEEEQIAENLFKQLKDNPEQSQNQRTQRRRGRNINSKETTNTPKEDFENIESMGTDGTDSFAGNEIKDLFKEDTTNTKSQKDEFDLGIGDLSEEGFNSKDTDELDSIKDFSLEDESSCPNCKKQNEKIIYCSKCGTAFCLNCAKTNGNETSCPKCGTKIKI